MVRDWIWYDFTQSKFGDEYLCLYLSLQKSIRKWFKIITLIFSAGGIWSAFKELKEYTIAALLVIGIIQLLTLIQSEIIHSEKQIDDLLKLRMLYFERSNNLEQLFRKYERGLVDTQAEEDLFNIRKSSKEIEELDGKLDIKKWNCLDKKAKRRFNNYINTYYGKRES